MAAAFPLFASIHHGSNIALVTSMGAFIGVVTSFALLYGIHKSQKLNLGGTAKRVLQANPLGYLLIAGASVSLPFGFEASLGFISTTETIALIQIYPLIATLTLSFVFLQTKPNVTAGSLVGGAIAISLIVYDLSGQSLLNVPIAGLGYGLMLAIGMAITCGGGLISKSNSFTLTEILTMVLIVCCLRFLLSVIPLLMSNETILFEYSVLKYAVFIGVCNHFLSGVTAALGVHYAKNNDVFLLWVLQTPFSVCLAYIWLDAEVSYAIILSVVVYGMSQFPLKRIVALIR